MDLQISVSQESDEILIITLSGKMNAVTISEFKNLSKKYIEENTIRILVDLESVDFIDSSGLSSLISALKGCREKGGFLRLVHIQPQVRRVFELTMLDKVFEMYQSIESAKHA